MSEILVVFLLMGGHVGAEALRENFLAYIMTKVGVRGVRVSEKVRFSTKR